MCRDFIDIAVWVWSASIFIKVHEEGTNYQKALMIYRNTPLDDSLLSPMQILQGRATRSDLPMSYAAKVKFGLASGQPPSLRPEKNEHAPTHDYKLNQDVMYLDPSSKKWFPATIVCLMDARRSYLIKTPKGVEYRKTQQYLKPYKPRKACVPPKVMKASDPVQGRPKSDTKPPNKLDL